MTEEENPFLRQKNQGEVETHTSRLSHSELTTRSFSLYRTDLNNIEMMAKHLNHFSHKKVNNSLVVRIALNHLKEALSKGGTRFEKEIEDIIKGSL